MDHHVSAFPGFAVKGVLLRLRCHAAVTATCVIVYRVHRAHASDAQNPSATAAPVSILGALESPHAGYVAAFPNVLLALIAAAMDVHLVILNV